MRFVTADPQNEYPARELACWEKAMMEQNHCGVSGFEWLTGLHMCNYTHVSLTQHLGSR